MLYFYLYFTMRRFFMVIYKEDLAANVADKLNFTKKDVRLVITALIDEIGKGLLKRDNVKIANLGTFRITERTGAGGFTDKKDYKINVIRFRACKRLRHMVK